jgi:hypothetical protein
MIKLIIGSLVVLFFAVPANCAEENSKFNVKSEVSFDHLKLAPQLNWGKDPFSRKPGFVATNPADEPNPGQFKLDAIVYDSEDPLAIINGITVGVDDEIGDLTVEEIAPNYVVVHGEGVRFELTLALPKDPRKRAEIRSLDSSEESEP